MRVIAGRLGGRIFQSPHGHRTHPMSDKMRGALYNKLGDISGLTVLDAFAGTGALSFEAVSRGAKHATAIEQDRNAQRTLGENIELLEIDHRVTLVRANVKSWLNTSRDHDFDIVILDPPYDRPQYDLLEDLAYHIKPGGRLVLSWPQNLELPRFANLQLVSHKNYGDGNLYVYDLAT